MHLGIDFGTCYSSAAVVINNEIYRIKEPLKGGYSFPSSVFLTKQGEIIIGEAADNQRKMQPLNYRREIKRFLSSEAPLFIGDRQFKPTELISIILQTLGQEAKEVAGQPLKHAVITVPASYDSYRRGLMEKAANEAGFSDVQLLIEPVAAAIYYDHSSPRAQSLKNGERLLVYDLGGGTFDAALLQKQDQIFELLALPVGDENLGGINFDKAIYQDFLAHCSEATRELLSSQEKREQASRIRLRLEDSVREFKHQLSVTTEYSDEFPIGGKLLIYQLNQQKFEDMIAPSIQKTCTLCDQLIQSVGLNWEQIDRVLIVGGSCRIPYIQKTLREHSQCSVERISDPELAVALGAAIHQTSSYYTDKEIAIKESLIKGKQITDSEGPTLYG